MCTHAPTSSLSSLKPSECIWKVLLLVTAEEGLFILYFWLVPMATFHGHCHGHSVEMVGVRLV